MPQTDRTRAESREEKLQAGTESQVFCEIQTSACSSACVSAANGAARRGEFGCDGSNTLLILGLDDGIPAPYLLKGAVKILEEKL